MKKDEIFEYVQKQYGTIPEYYGVNYRTVQYSDIKMENGMQ